MHTIIECRCSYLLLTNHIVISFCGLKGKVLERVTPDVAFFNKELECAHDFFKNCIIPELLAKYFSAPKPAAAAFADQS